MFRRGEAGIDYLDRRDDLRDAVPADDVRHRHAAAAALALLHHRAAESLVPVAAAGWRNVGVAHHVDTLIDDHGMLAVRTKGPDHDVAVLVAGKWEDVGSATTTDEFVDLTSAGIRRRHRVRLAGPHVDVNGPEGQSSFTLRTEDDPDEQGGTAGECRAPLPGAITRVLVAVGDVVEDGDGLVVLEAMKMEHTLRAGGAGTVTEILCAPGAQVDVGDVLVVVEPHEGPPVSAGRKALRVANCSGFFGDRVSAAREMVEGGPIDVLTGDWLAELTMYILHKTRERSGGYARTFLQQLEEVLPTCIERGITIVSNAGGLNPEGLAAAVRELARRQGVSVRVASVSGDDITARVPDLLSAGNAFVNLDTGEPLAPMRRVVTANAYLGARPIADALDVGGRRSS